MRKPSLIFIFLFFLCICICSVGALGIGAQTSGTKPPPGKTAPAKPIAKPTQKPASKPAPTPPARTAPKVEAGVPFSVGETLSYDVSWSSTVSAGTAVLRVQEKRPSYNSVAYYIVAEAQPGSLLSRLYTLYYKADTLLDAYTLLPQRGSLFSREGKRQRMKITEFNHGAKAAKFRMETSRIMVKDLAVPSDSQDLLSAIYSLRAIPATTGDRVSIPVSDNGRMYMAEFAFGATETVKMPFGSVSAIKVTPSITDDAGKAVARGSSLWLSNDQRRVPLRLETQLAVGRFVLALKNMP